MKKMKKNLILIGLVFTLISATVFGTADEIINALKSGSATEVSQHFDNFIDFTLPEKDEIQNMGKNQAALTLKSYYDEMGIKNFQLTSKREAGSIMYITGKLQGKTRNSNLTLILKKSNSNYFISSIRIG